MAHVLGVEVLPWDPSPQDSCRWPGILELLEFEGKQSMQPKHRTAETPVTALSLVPGLFGTAMNRSKTGYGYLDLMLLLCPIEKPTLFGQWAAPKTSVVQSSSTFPNYPGKVENIPALGYSENQLTKWRLRKLHDISFIYIDHRWPRPISHDFPWFPTSQFCSSRAFQSISIGGRSRWETRHVVDKNEATKMLELYGVYVCMYIYI